MTRPNSSDEDCDYEDAARVHEKTNPTAGALYVGPCEAKMNAMADCLQPVVSAQPDCQTQSQLIGRTSA